MPPVDKALGYLETRERRQSGRRAVIGSPATVRAGLEEVAAEYGAEEVILVTITHDHGARRRSYELIADAFGLGLSPSGHCNGGCRPDRNRGFVQGFSTPARLRGRPSEEVLQC